MQNMPQRGISAGPGGWSVYEDDNWAGEGMRMSKKVPVLVTGGAGYIGSHAVLALKDAGWDVAVIDNLVTGFAFAVPEGVPLYQGDIADGDLLARILPSAASRRSCISPDRWWCPNRSRTR
jgi:hypothetical protein